MANRSSFRQVSRLYRRFQFHVSAFVLGVAGLCLCWALFREPLIPDWLMYLLMIWVVALIAELARFIYVFKRSSKNKNYRR
jgi:CDP-diglyceride synthetase